MPGGGGPLHPFIGAAAASAAPQLVLVANAWRDEKSLSGVVQLAQEYTMSNRGCGVSGGGSGLSASGGARPQQVQRVTDSVVRVDTVVGRCRLTLRNPS